MRTGTWGTECAEFGRWQTCSVLVPGYLLGGLPLCACGRWAQTSSNRYSVAAAAAAAVGTSRSSLGSHVVRSTRAWACWSGFGLWCRCTCTTVLQVVVFFVVQAVQVLCRK